MISVFLKIACYYEHAIVYEDTYNMFDSQHNNFCYRPRACYGKRRTANGLTFDDADKSDTCQIAFVVDTEFYVASSMWEVIESDWSVE